MGYALLGIESDPRHIPRFRAWWPLARDARWGNKSIVGEGYSLRIRRLTWDGLIKMAQLPELDPKKSGATTDWCWASIPAQRSDRLMRLGSVLELQAAHLAGSASTPVGQSMRPTRTT